jgi:hypothetical protein
MRPRETIFAEQGFARGRKLLRALSQSAEQTVKVRKIPNPRQLPEEE